VRTKQIGDSDIVSGNVTDDWASDRDTNFIDRKLIGIACVLAVCSIADVLTAMQLTRDSSEQVNVATRCPGKVTVNSLPTVCTSITPLVSVVRIKLFI